MSNNHLPDPAIVEQFQSDGAVVTCDPGIAAYDCHSGDRLWSYDGLTSSSAIWFGRSVICATGTELWTIDSQTGRLLQRDFYEQLLDQNFESVNTFLGFIKELLSLFDFGLGAFTETINYQIF